MRQKCREGRRELIRPLPQMPAAGRASQAGVEHPSHGTICFLARAAETPGHTCWVFRTTLEQEVHTHMEDEQLSQGGAVSSSTAAGGLVFCCLE